MLNVSKSKLVAVSFVVVLLVNIVWIQVESTSVICRQSFRPENKITAVTNRGFGVDNIEISPAWAYRIPQVSPNEGIVIADTYLVVSHTACNQLVAFELDTGKINWTTTVSGPDQLAYDEDRYRIYLTTVGIWKRQLVALDLRSGKTIWKNGSQNFKRGGLTVRISQNGRIWVTGTIFHTRKEIYRSVDPDTGTFGEVANLSDVNSQIHDMGEGLYWSLSYAPSQLHINNKDGEVWVSNPLYPLHTIASTRNEVLIQYSDELLALEKNTGAVMWIYDQTPLVSNLSTTDDWAVILDKTATIYVLDITSGEAIAKILFDLPMTTTQEYSDTGKSWIGLSENRLIVYFGDTETLEVFELVQ